MYVYIYMYVYRQRGWVGTPPSCLASFSPSVSVSCEKMPPGASGAEARKVLMEVPATNPQDSRRWELLTVTDAICEERRV